MTAKNPAPAIACVFCGDDMVIPAVTNLNGTFVCADCAVNSHETPEAPTPGTAPSLTVPPTTEQEPPRVTAGDGGEGQSLVAAPPTVDHAFRFDPISGVVDGVSVEEWVYSAAGLVATPRDLVSGPRDFSLERRAFVVVMEHRHHPESPVVYRSIGPHFWIDGAPSSLAEAEARGAALALARNEGIRLKTTFFSFAFCAR